MFNRNILWNMFSTITYKSIIQDIVKTFQHEKSQKDNCYQLCR